MKVHDGNAGEREPCCHRPKRGLAAYGGSRPSPIATAPGGVRLGAVGAAASRNTGRRLGEIETTTLVLHGEEHVIATLRNGQQLPGAIRRLSFTYQGGERPRR